MVGGVDRKGRGMGMGALKMGAGLIIAALMTSTRTASRSSVATGPASIPTTSSCGSAAQPSAC